MAYHWPEDDLEIKRKPWRWWAFIIRATVIAAGAGFWFAHLHGLWPKA
jgi:hypothetical protein